MNIKIELNKIKNKIINKSENIKNLSKLARERLFYKNLEELLSL